MHMTRAAGITGAMALLLLQPQLQSQRSVATPVVRQTAAAMRRRPSRLSATPQRASDPCMTRAVRRRASPDRA